MKSIMQRKDGTCYLCQKLYSDDSYKTIEEHHAIFGTAGRALSEKFGLKIYLCYAHHRTSKEAVHMNKEIANMIKRDAQECFEKKYPHMEFRAIFGKNYKTEEPEKVDFSLSGDGFMFLDEEI